AAHQGNVDPGDGEDTGRAPGGGGDGAERGGAEVGVVAEWMAGQERGQMFGHGDRAHAGAAAAVGDAEGLVQVEVADVGPDFAGAGEADLGVHVRPVHVDL